MRVTVGIKERDSSGSSKRPEITAPVLALSTCTGVISSWHKVDGKCVCVCVSFMTS